MSENSLDTIFHPSPNFNERNAPISMIVLHYTALPSCEASLERMCAAEHPSGRVSAHYLVDLDGTVYQLVDEAKRAWHAGIGSWGDVRDVNSAAIGIEIQNVGLDEDGRRVPFPDAQIEAVIALCQGIQRRYGIQPWNIVGHSDVSPSRKQDPGEAFPWKRLAEAGVGLWTDDFADPEWLAEKMLASIGYDVADFNPEFQPGAALRIAIRPLFYKTLRVIVAWKPAPPTGNASISRRACQRQEV